MQPLFQRIGGPAAVDAAVELFYRKVMADPRINGFFEGVDIKRQAAKQKAFLTMAFGGPKQYSGRTLRKAHEAAVKQGMSDWHFDVVLELLGATLRELGVPEPLVLEAAGIAESTRDDVLNRQPVGAK